MLHVSEQRQEVVDSADVKSKRVLRRNKLRRDVEHSLCQVPVRLLASVVRLASLEERLRRLAVLDVVLVHEGVKARESLNRLLTQLVLVQQGAELTVVLGTAHFA